MAEIDWAAIETEYVTTKISYRQLANKYHVNYKNLATRGKAGKWPEKRNRHYIKTTSKAETKTATNQANRLARLITASEKTLDVALKALDDEKQFNRYIVSDMQGGDSLTEERQFDKVDTKALKELTGVIKDLTGLMRDFYGVPTPAQAEAQRVAAERLELDKKKAEPANAADGQQFGIVLLPDVQPLEPPKEGEEGVVMVDE